ncbi:L-mandelate dehydrogenase [Dioszegia hungarica]|uniref:L-mandelate dehydrogenase n=1 Tax=Dioszegia hungarica TaxID=4972 RepID=A0AA38HAD7_9TREE|nr:L-mandelate dehydrogenase [Dioszegia hungarica]KAI9635394.1 L-mandelate dehydrogenase [Dioszegia hungarica]
MATVGSMAAAAIVVMGVVINSRDKTIQCEVDARRASPAVDSAPAFVTAELLKKHSTEDSLWVAVNGQVWDVTAFAAIHPGGAQVLIDNSGKDASKLFNGIHPPDTLKQQVDHVRLVGPLDPSLVKKPGQERDEEQERIAAKRATLCGVDSVVSVPDFERYARDLLTDDAWYYYSTGADAEHSMHDNMAAFQRVRFRPRVFRNVAEPDTSTTILGVPSAIPIYVSPTARNGLGQPDGEVAVTRGAADAGIMQVVSHYASKSFDEIAAAAKEGQKIGWQVYLHPDRENSAKAIKHAVELGAASIWITADTAILGKRERERHMHTKREEIPHGTPMSRVKKTYATHDPSITWDDIAWVKSLAPGLPIIVKGIGAWEDVVLAKQYGADAVVLSNHGGRQLDTAASPLKTLYDLHQNRPDLLHKAGLEVYIDGGITRGTDVLKALCLGARAVGLGRPFIYAATGWGSEGVEKAVMILQEEMDIGMKLLGVTRLDQLGPEYLDCSKL